ncbi:MAG: site-2 protease family protein [Bacteroidia bacterium]
MKGAISLGKILGIKVYIHFTFFFIFVWRAYTAYAEEGQDLNGILFECLIVAAIFVCVLMHEYGHALAARRYGIQTKQIVLLPIGGVAQLERMPKNPTQELVVALAGPLVNVVLALLLLPVVLLQFPLEYFTDDQYIDVLLNSFTARLLLVNIILVVFNMLPAFPMDGGRVLRALLGFKLSFEKATKIAARIGQVMAVGFIILGFYYNFFWILIGLFVFFGAEMELRMASRKNMRFGFSIRDALLTNFTLLHTSETVEQALPRVLQSELENDFLVEENDQITGVVSREKIIESLPAGEENKQIGEIMQTDIAMVSVNDSLDEVLQSMQLYNTSVLPVYEDEILIGAISHSSIQAQILLHRAMNQ